MKLSELIEKLEEIQEKCCGDPECLIGSPFPFYMTEENIFYVPESEDTYETVVFG